VRCCEKRCRASWDDEGRPIWNCRVCGRVHGERAGTSLGDRTIQRAHLGPIDMGRQTVPSTQTALVRDRTAPLPRLASSYRAAVQDQLRAQADFDVASSETRDASARKLAGATERVSKTAHDLHGGIRNVSRRKRAQGTPTPIHKREPPKRHPSNERSEALLRDILNAHDHAANPPGILADSALERD
jgi:hypothetical protein